MTKNSYVCVISVLHHGNIWFLKWSQLISYDTVHKSEAFIYYLVWTVSHLPLLLVFSNRNALTTKETVNTHLAIDMMGRQRLQHCNCMLHEHILHTRLDHAISANLIIKPFTLSFQVNIPWINHPVSCWLLCAWRWFIYMLKRSMWKKSVLTVHNHCIQVKQDCKNTGIHFAFLPLCAQAWDIFVEISCSTLG